MRLIPAVSSPTQPWKEKMARTGAIPFYNNLRTENTMTFDFCNQLGTNISTELNVLLHPHQLHLLVEMMNRFPDFNLYPYISC